MIKIEDSLLEEVKSLTGIADGGAVVSRALGEFVARRKHKQAIELFSSVEYGFDFDIGELRLVP